jgi:hypothetical protein
MTLDQFNQIINSSFTGMALLAVAFALILVFYAIDKKNKNSIFSSKKTKKTP